MTPSIRSAELFTKVLHENILKLALFNSRSLENIYQQVSNRKGLLFQIEEYTGLYENLQN